MHTCVLQFDEHRSRQRTHVQGPAAMRKCKTPSQCTALTLAGKRCGITAESRMVDDRGHKVNEPLLLGARQCRLHLQLFCTGPATVDDYLLFYLDFETSGLDIIEHYIVEIGVLCESAACFQTVVCPPVFAEAVQVRGIPNEELKQRPTFVEAFLRMFRFCENLAEMALADDDSSDDEVTTASLRGTPPRVLICAHNGRAFDFPFLCSMCLRSGLDIGRLARWLYLDSLEVFRAIDAGVHGGCVKLGGLLRSLAPAAELQPHRALEDCRALKAVVDTVCAALCVSQKTPPASCLCASSMLSGKYSAAIVSIAYENNNIISSRGPNMSHNHSFEPAV